MPRLFTANGSARDPNLELAAASILRDHDFQPDPKIDVAIESDDNLDRESNCQ